MASGDSLIIGLVPRPPDANAATMDIKAGGSTPAEQLLVFEFDDATDEYMDFGAVMPEHYSGNGIEVEIAWYADTATSNAVVWRAAFRRLDSAEDLGSSHTYSYQTTTTTTANDVEKINVTTISFSSSQIDGVVAGDPFILRISRDADNASDTMAGDAQLVAEMISIKEA